MPCYIKLSILIITIISKSISFEIIFEDNFNELNEKKWEIISSQHNMCQSEFLFKKIRLKI